MRREITLYGPSGGRKKVREGSSLERQLRSAGWAKGGHPPAPRRSPEPAHLGTSETARQAREALNTLTPEEWIKDWGYVLCAALDEVELQRSVIIKRIDSLAGISTSALQMVKSVGDHCLAWVTETNARTSLVARWTASRLLARRVMDAAGTFSSQIDAFIRENEGDAGRLRSSAVAGSPAGRARASQILADLAAEIPEDAPENRRQEIVSAIQKVRARFLGGSNLPASGDEDEEVPS